MSDILALRDEHPGFVAASIEEQLRWVIGSRLEWELENKDAKREAFYEQQFNDRYALLVDGVSQLRSALQAAEKRIKCQTVLLDLITEPDRSPSTATTRDGCWVDDEYNEDCWMCRGDGYRDMTAAEVRAECEKIADANARAARVIRQWLGWKDRPAFGSKDQSAIDSLLAQLDERSVSRG